MKKHKIYLILTIILIVTIGYKIFNEKNIDDIKYKNNINQFFANSMTYLGQYYDEFEHYHPKMYSEWAGEYVEYYVFDSTEITAEYTFEGLFSSRLKSIHLRLYSSQKYSYQNLVELLFNLCKTNFNNQYKIYYSNAFEKTIYEETKYYFIWEYKNSYIELHYYVNKYNQIGYVYLGFSREYEIQNYMKQINLSETIFKYKGNATK